LAKSESAGPRAIDRQGVFASVTANNEQANQFLFSPLGPSVWEGHHGKETVEDRIIARVATQIRLYPEDSYHSFFFHSVESFEFLEKTVILRENLPSSIDGFAGKEAELLVKIVDTLTPPLQYLWIKLYARVGKDACDGLIAETLSVKLVEKGGLEDWVLGSGIGQSHRGVDYVERQTMDTHSISGARNIFIILILMDLGRDCNANRTMTAKPSG
jgi:hypothetical protein